MSTRWIIIADGEQLSETRLKSLAQDRQVLVCDGAIHRCLELGIEPDVLLGDFDSVSSSLRGATRRGNPEPDLDRCNNDDLIPSLRGATRRGNPEPDLDRCNNDDLIPSLRGATRRGNPETTKPTIIHTPDQNKTDSEKALAYALEQGATDIILCQAMGSRTDHSLNNLSLLSRYHNPDKKLTLARENEVVFFVKDTTINLNNKKNCNIGILGFPQAIVTSDGLAYECERLTVSIDQGGSISNKIIADTTHIKVSGSVLITLESI